MIKIKLLLMLLLVGTLARAQMLTPMVVSSGGNYATGGGYSLAQNFGELVVTTVTAGSSILTQGFEQPYPSGTVGIQDPADAGMAITLYPNPASDQVSVTVRSDKNASYRFRITDLLGKEIASALYPASSIGMVYHFDVSNMSSGLYLLVVTSEDQKFSKTIRFNKN